MQTLVKNLAAVVLCLTLASCPAGTELKRACFVDANGEKWEVTYSPGPPQRFTGYKDGQLIDNLDVEIELNDGSEHSGQEGGQGPHATFTLGSQLINPGVANINIIGEKGTKGFGTDAGIGDFQ